MFPSLLELAARVLGKHFLVIETFRYIPDEIVQLIFNEFIRTVTNVSIINEKDLTKIVNLLTECQPDLFCSAFSYSINNHLNLVTNQFYFHLLTRLQNSLLQLDFSHAFQRFDNQEKMTLLNLIGQMENIEYLRLTHNHLDDDHIRILTASKRIRSKALANLHHLHLQGNHLTSRSARFLKCLTSLETLFVSHLPDNEISSFSKEFENLYRCTCSSTHVWQEIINVGWISNISQFHSPTNDHHFYRKRRRIDPEDSSDFIKFVRHCSTCRPTRTVTKEIKKKVETIETNKTFIDPYQANDLLSSYL